MNDTQEIINEHIGDSYNWHIATIRGEHKELHLPVIVRGQDGQWHVFSSGRLAHGHSWEGFAIDSQGKVAEIMPDGSLQRPIDLSVTKNVAGLMMSGILITMLILYCARWYRKHPLQTPGGLVGAIELVTCYVYDNVVESIIGKDKGMRFAPYLLTAFYFILTCNLVGLIPFFPFGMNLTGNIAVTVTLALATFLVVNLTATRHYWRDILWPDVPLLLKCPIPLMPVIEILGMFTKPFSLTIRLLANIMAGHIIILSIICMIFTTVSMGSVMHSGITAVAVGMAIFMNMMELMVAFLQAFVFVTLSASYISAAQATGEAEQGHK